MANTFSGSTILDIFITKYDSCGNALWAKKAEGMGEDAANCIVLDASNNVYAAGYFRSSSLTFDFQTLTNVSTEYDLFFTKLGNSATGINFFNNKLDFSIFPNPANVNINIIVPQKSTIEILNIQGQTIIQQQIQQGKTDIDISKLAKGVYILRLNSNNKTAVTRIVKE